MRRIEPAVLTILCAGMLLAPAAALSAPPPAADGEINTILIRADDQHPRLDEASLLPLSDGRLYLAYSDFYGGNENDEGPARILAMSSPDRGRTWSAPAVVQENIGRVNVMEPSLVELPSGRVLMTFMRKDRDHLQTEPEVLILMIKHSDDGCRTWSEPRPLCAGADDEVCHDRLIRLSSGRLLLPGRRVWLSDDDGQTWRRAANGGGGEPSVAELADGSLLMLWRSDSGSKDFNLHMMRSRDGGENWTTDPRDSGPASASAPCILRRVPGSADLLLVWCRGLTRTDLTSAVSHDGGWTWENFRTLEEAETWPPLRSHQYASLAFQDGYAHLTYREVHKTPQARAAKAANGPGQPHHVEAYMHLVYRRVPIAWFYATTARREPLFDLRQIAHHFRFPATERAAPDEARQPTGTERLGALRVKAREGKLTPEEKAELDRAMSAREWANRPKLPPAVIPAQNAAAPQQYFVDNERGDDAANGLAARPASPRGGPVRTLARGVSLLRPGDTLHLAANAAPYRETLVLNDVSGNPQQPIVIDGHGATITGCDPLRSDWVSAGAEGLYQSDQFLSELEEFGDDAKLQRVFFLFHGSQQRMGRTSKAKHAAFKAPQALQPGEWTYEAASKTFYVKVAGALEDAGVEAPYRRNGVTIRGRSGVSHVLIRNLVCTHVLNDGFNLHGVGRAIFFENIGALENGDDGFSPHETIECSINGFWSCRNSTGIGIGNQAVVQISNAHLEGNFAADFALGHAPVMELRNAIIRTTEPDAHPLLVINPQDFRLTFDNVQIAATGRARFELPQRSTFTGRHLTATVPQWIVAGRAEVTESVIGGRTLQCMPEGRWTGDKNVYGSEMKLGGIAEPNATRKDLRPEIFTGSGPAFPAIGADPSAMRIPSCPWLKSLSPPGVLR